MEHEPIIGGIPLGHTEHSGVDMDAVHCLEASKLAQIAFDRTVKESAESIINRNELAEFTIAQLEILANVAQTNSRWSEVHRIGMEISRRFECGEVTRSE